MRFGFDGTPLLGERTGVGWYTHELVKAVAALAPDDEAVVFPISWRTARHVDLGPSPTANISVVRRVAPARPLWTLWDRVAFPPLEWFVACDVFHATNFLAPPSRRTPTVVTVHDIGFVHRPDQVSAPIARMAALLPRVLAGAAAVIVVSQFVADELAGWQPRVADRITVIHNGGHRRGGAAPAPSPAGMASEPHYALMLGTLEPRKNVVLALDALVELGHRGVELRLVLAGGASPHLDVDALLAERALGPERVVRTGYVDDETVAALLAGARMLVFPSLYEGFGMPLVEAMAAGVPVVAARAGATPEVVGDAALLVDPTDSDALATAMAQVATDDALHARMAAAGRVQAARFSWERAAAASLDVYRRAAAG